MNFVRVFLMTLVMAFCSSFLMAQAPQGVNYQAVARDNSGNPLISTAVNVQFDIRQSTPTGTIVYSETHASTTNQFGLFTLEIGAGTPVSGTFPGINWGLGIYYLQVTVNGDVMPASQLLSVPYALHANTATSGTPGANGHNALADSVAEPPGTNCPNGGYLIHMGADDNDDGTLQPLEYDISYYICNGIDGAANNNDTSATNELQTISISNDTIFLSSGGFVVLPTGAGDGDWQVTGNDMSSMPTGNVGIGTNTPTRKLEVSTTSTGGDGILIDNTSTGNPGVMFSSQGTPRFVMGIHQSDGDKFKIGTTNVFTNTRFTIDQLGNVGIGTTNPLHRLTVGSADTVVASFLGINPNGSLISVGGVGSAPVGSVFLSGGGDSAIVALDPAQKTMFMANTTTGGHVGIIADSSAALYGINVANIAGDLIYNETNRIYNESDTIYNYASSGSIINVNQGSFLTDSLFVLGASATNAGWVLTNNGFGKAEWQAPSGGGLWQSNSPDIYFNTGHVGIGTISPQEALHIAKDGGLSSVGLLTTAGTGTSKLVLSGSNGTLAAPTASTAPQVLGSLGWSGFDGGIHQVGAEIRAFAAENWSAGATGTDLMFYTTSVGSSGPVERMRILNDGNVGIGTTNPLVSLHVASPGQTMAALQSSHNGPADQAGTLVLLRSRGSTLAPTAVQANDRLGKVEWVGWNGFTNSYEEKASIRVVADETYTSGSTASHMEFHVNPLGQSTTFEAMYIDNNGFVGLDNGAPQERLHIRNGTIRIDDGANPYTFPTADGAANEVLTTDGAGNVSWQPGGSSSVWSLTGSDAYYNAGKVGVGMTNPTHLFHVQDSSASGAAILTRIETNLGTDILTIRNDRKIGIGTVAPSSTLELLYGGNDVNAFDLTFNNTSASTGSSALRVDARNTGTGGIWAGEFQITNSGNATETVALNARNTSSGTNNFGVRAEVNAAGTTNYGIYSEVAGATTNWAAFFANGNVYVGDTLVIPTDAGQGKVLTSDPSGKASWKTNAVAFETFITNPQGVINTTFGNTGAIIVRFDGEIMDEGGNNFDPNPGVNNFKAPVSGIYSIQVNVVFENLGGPPNQLIDLGLMKNGGFTPIKVTTVAMESGNGGIRKGCSINTTVRLSVGDVLHVEAIDVNGPGSNIQILPSEGSSFSGHLVYAD